MSKLPHGEVVMTQGTYRGHKLRQINSGYLANCVQHLHERTSNAELIDAVEAEMRHRGETDSHFYPPENIRHEKKTEELDLKI